MNERTEKLLRALKRIAQQLTQDDVDRDATTTAEVRDIVMKLLVDFRLTQIVAAAGFPARNGVARELKVQREYATDVVKLGNRLALLRPETVESIEWTVFATAEEMYAVLDARKHGAEISSKYRQAKDELDRLQNVMARTGKEFERYRENVEEFKNDLTPEAVERTQARLAELREKNAEAARQVETAAAQLMQLRRDAGYLPTDPI